MYNNDLPNRAELPSSKQLMRSTLIAVIVAAVLLVTVVLPAEYGIDPTRVGRVIGLTKMGELKMSLAEEARIDREAAVTNTTDGQKAPAPPTSPVAGTTKAGTAGGSREDVMTVTLEPGQGVEIKLDMARGAKAKYEWSTNGGGLNFDLHGDNPQKAFISYAKGTNSQTDAGEFVADFDGSHGWFWRNRTGNDVTLTLKTKGAYKEIKRVV